MNIRKDLFKIFQNNKDQYDLYEKIMEFINMTIEDVKGEENAKFYDLVNELHNSINNAGWEARHHEQIKLLWNIRNDISNKYDKYLP